MFQNIFKQILSVFNRTGKRFNIGQTELSICVNFNNYPPELFDFDMLLLRLINSREWKKRQIPSELLEKAKLVQRNEIMFNRDIYRKVVTGQIPKTSYDDFKIHITKTLAEQSQHILQTMMQEILLGRKTLALHFKLINTYNQDYLAMYCAEKSNAKNAYFEISGTLLAGRMYAPWKYANQIDCLMLEKLLSHELQHHKDRKLVNIQIMLEKELEAAMKNKTCRFNATAIIMYTLLSKLYTEGIASYVEQKRASKIVFEQSKVKELKRMLRKMARAKDNKSLYDRYENRFCPSSKTGEYYIGSLMCYFIGLFIQKQNGQKTIIILHPEKKRVPISILGKYLMKYKSVHLPCLEKPVYDEVYQKVVDAAKDDVFFELYINACNELGIPESLIFLDNQTLAFIRKISKEVTQKYGNPLKTD